MAIIILLWALGFGLLELYAHRGTVPSGVKIGSTEIGGLPFEEAKQAVEQEQQRIRAGQVNYYVPAISGNAPAHIRMNWEQSGVDYSSEELAQELSKLNGGTLWNRVKTRWYFPKQWQYTVRWDRKKLTSVLSPSWEKKQFGSPINARRILLANDTFRYEAGSSAIRIDWSTLNESFRKAIPKTSQDAFHDKTLEIPLWDAPPAVTLDILKEQGIDHKLTEFQTHLTTSTEGRVHNVEAASQIIDGMLLAPGEVFDYSKVVERAEHTYGFQPAPVIFQGRLIPGIGGGICQVSSTLYGAAIRAGLQIVERRNHSLPVSYLPKGQDATFAKGYINFKFRNTTSHYVLIHSQVEDLKLSVKLFGDLPEDEHYEITSKVIEEIQAQNKYVANAALPAGSSQLIQPGKPGYIVETYRTKWIQGKPKAPERISRDTYPAQPNLIGVHHIPTDPGSESVPRPSKDRILEDGVSSLLIPYS
ncbi:vancomycin resistance protein YoaR [Paenibacillus shirakamiensis]|uniref:Vancomycin resistance protein YoaR n=1 Tax=Paenibacillus shirakamiensis TaxID=1265935 RepID=A0ABS4JKZ4_9BACL|nr:VanW family protein [Paenibacillus shirakamiensis]MBP2001751.1 vancomycin resistance protein YoaR [Paenibacillus shirakamiensis]